MNVLIVVAHPDDEVLGCGVAGAALADAGATVRACMLAAGAEARGGRPSDNKLAGDIERAQAILGFAAPILGGFPNIQLNTVPHLELVRFIEQAIVTTGAQVVFTHHPADVNDDHVHTSRACQAAIRLFQRKPGVPRVTRLYFAEVLSSTDWSLPGGTPQFTPDTFVDATRLMPRKLEALRAYSGVMRDAPHPRSDQVLQGLAHYRGGQSGFAAAEAFQTAFCSGSAPQLFGV
ncbi:MAG: PIG-L family deacetylase [Pseudomonadota bacterium]